MAAKKPERERRRARTREAGDWGERSRAGGSGAPGSGVSADHWSLGGRCERGVVSAESLPDGWEAGGTAAERCVRRPRRSTVQRHIYEIDLDPNPMIQMFQL